MLCLRIVPTPTEFYRLATARGDTPPFSWAVVRPVLSGCKEAARKLRRLVYTSVVRKQKLKFGLKPRLPSTTAEPAAIWGRADL
jgi:hypothetical protein